MPDCILALDAGGTSIKLALMTEIGEPVPDTVCQQPFSGQDRVSMERAFIAAAAAARDMARERGFTIRAVGAACPGPFDYVTGMSLMTHKWPGLLNVPITPLIAQALPNVPVHYLHDSTAYLLGEAYCGAAREAKHPAGVMLGTGFGFATMAFRRVRVRPDQRPATILWDARFRDGTVEDYVSRRAIRGRYQELTGCNDVPDVKEIALLARRGRAEAITAFSQTGEALGDVLRMAARMTVIDMVVLGGQIALSHELITPYVGELPMPLRLAEHPMDAALRGAAQFCILGHDQVTTEVRV